MSVYLARSGMADMFLTEKPDITYFRTVYKRDAQFLTRNVEIPFEQSNPIPGDTLISTFPQAGDYIDGVTLKILLPNISTSNATTWSYPYIPSGGDFMYGFDSSGTQVFTISLAPRKPSLSSSLWLKSTNVNVQFLSSESKFNFQTSQPYSYVVFSNSDTAQLFGFIYNPINLFSGFVRFDVKNTKSQVTLQECGWLNGSSLFSYTDDVCYKFINTVSLYIGKQLIQEFTGEYMKFYKDVNTSCKNNPVLKLLEGDSNPVDFNRVYYFSVPFIHIPMHALKRHDIQVVMKTNNLTNMNFNASLLIDLNIFDKNVKLPQSYMIPFSQIQYFDNQKLDIKGPVKHIITNQPDYFSLEFNGERYCDSEKTKFDAFENFRNVTTSNVVVFDGPINMSRIIDQKWSSSNVSVHAETVNILAVENDIAGLLYNYTEKTIKKLTSNALVQIPSQPPETLYLFDYIPLSASNAVAIYSMRKVNVLYTGPVVRLRDSVTLQEDDFYTDGDQTYLVNSSNVSLSNWSSNTVYISKWYDQSGYNNIIYQGVFSPSVDFINGKYCINFYNNNQSFTLTYCWLTLLNDVSFNQFTCIFKPSVIGRNGSSCIFQNTRLKPNIDSSLFITSSLGISTIPSIVTSNINNVINGTFTLNSWNTMTGTSNSIFDSIRTIGDNGYVIAESSYTGYMFELGFFNGNSFTTPESNNYYLRRPSGF